jgi:hypothetical protein
MGTFLLKFSLKAGSFDFLAEKTTLHTVHDAEVVTAFSLMKTIFSPRLFSKCMDRQIVENHYRCLILNKMNYRVC